MNPNNTKIQCIKARRHFESTGGKTDLLLISTTDGNGGWDAVSRLEMTGQISVKGTSYSATHCHDFDTDGAKRFLEVYQEISKRNEQYRPDRQPLEIEMSQLVTNQLKIAFFWKDRDVTSDESFGWFLESKQCDEIIRCTFEDIVVFEKLAYSVSNLLK